MSDNARVVLITGASSGIGLAATNAFLDAGYTVYGLSRHPFPAARHIHLTADIADEAQARAAVETVLAREGRTVLLADGRSRKLDKPKRKNIRHVTFFFVFAFAAVRAGMKDHLTDAAVRRALACCRPGVSTEMGGT